MRHADASIIHVVGTRPNFMKIAPLIESLEERGVSQSLVHTGQHYDHGLSDAFFEDLEMPYPDYFLRVGSGSHAAQTARVISRLEPVLNGERPLAVVVPGDVNSSMASALVAVQLGIPVIHLEGGLRSWDRTMPEEHNRVVIDHLAELLLTPSRDADQNLLREGVPASKIDFVGNLMIDSLRKHEAQARELDLARREYGVGDYALVTLHRPAIVDDESRLLAVLDSLENVASTRPVLFPVHPRTAKRLERAGWRARNVRLLQPQGYLRFLSLEASASVVLTDSGGVQEETTALGVPCLTLRVNTERPVTVEVGTNRVLGLDTNVIASLPDTLNSTRPGGHRLPERWDGQAAERAADAILARFAAGRRAVDDPLPSD